MASESSRKVRALMMIAMLAVAEGSRVQQIVRFRDAFKSRSGSSSRGTGKRNGHHSSDAQVEAALEADMVLKDQAFHKQLEAMAGHLETFAYRMKAKMGYSAQEKEMAKEMVTLAEPSSYASSADFPEKVIQTLADPKLRQQQERVSHVLKSLMLHSDFQRAVELIAPHCEQVKDSTVLDSGAGHDIAQEVPWKNDMVIATTKCLEKASDVLEMLSGELQKEFDSTEWLKDSDLYEPAVAVSSASPELEGRTTEVRSAMNTIQRSLLQVNQSSGQERGNMSTWPSAKGGAPATPAAHGDHGPVPVFEPALERMNFVAGCILLAAAGIATLNVALLLAAHFTGRSMPLVLAVTQPGKQVSLDRIKLECGRIIAFALLFLVGADALETLMKPTHDVTMEELLKLGLVGAIRTTLAYFLGKEVEEIADHVEHIEHAEHEEHSEQTKNKEGMIKKNN